MKTSTYLVKIVDHLNKSEQILSVFTTLETYIDTYTKICNSINKENDFIVSVCMSDATATLTTHQEVLRKGYLYNTKSKITQPAYNLSLIKVNEELSDLFHETNSDTQTLPPPAPPPPQTNAGPDNKIPDNFLPSNVSLNVTLADKLLNELKSRLSLPNTGLKQTKLM